ncbi:EF hand domain protein [Drechmeria coniospora]|uniref:EF hand domain protein n=1 Tax=Drechmeria coniospora TaxID=98403 RepID=A0A151GKG2_DRECN|nr:EF hand domain protein [Drechmeria coniospora]KYK57579.1 EF hand domain protein [Drechmeria coniospora]
MWPSTPSVDTLTRPRLVVALVSALAAASVGYYAYQSRQTSTAQHVHIGGSLQRSNAVRRSSRRSQRNDAESSSSSEYQGDGSSVIGPAPVPDDAETVVEAAEDEWWTDTSGISTAQRAGHNIVNLLFRVSEDNAKRNGCVHRGCQCNSCGMVPIRGVRYRCANCADFDLCEACETQGVHIKTHIFYKIRVPAPPFGPRQMQPVWYTGDPDTCRRNLPRGLMARLVRDTGFERPELEAFWEQWTFMANTEWRDDPDELRVAMDRKTFERCLVPTGGSRHAAPNLIHDRMFSFYDSNHDDLIGFGEFLDGLSYRKRKDKLRKVFEGYDIDGDGYVNRRDFLRMFRAYYVLYKQMHKDILDGLEDQLLASTEAQQLVTSRQPLSSLFGREGRVPAADGNMRFEGKMYRPDGSVDIDAGYNGAIAENRGDTTTREDILTSLFAYLTAQRPRRRFTSSGDTDSSWQAVHRSSVDDTYQTYLATLLQPPSNLDDLPEFLAGISNPEVGETDDELDTQDEGDGDVEGHDHDAHGNCIDSDSTAPPQNDSERRARFLANSRRRASKLEKRRRDMARGQLHERWKRRHFYLDEEEGGLAPDDWGSDEDILAKLKKAADNSKSADRPTVFTRSRSSSKVRFAEDVDDFEIRSNPSTSSRSIPERWGGMDIPDAERDAGKEILYQVTQQAFNELLDIIFKTAEDMAIEAAETKERRERFKTDIEALEEANEKDEVVKSVPSSERRAADEGAVAPAAPAAQAAATAPNLETSGDSCTAVLEPRNALEIDVDMSFDLSDYRIPSESSVADDAEVGEYRDPTLPQFRPNNDSSPDDTPSPKRLTSTGVLFEEFVHESASASERSTESEPNAEMLQRWKMLNLAEAKAAERGGWGRLGFEEFEAIYRNQECLGNRLDYLGSWIDFCIP